jgi:hypothetical protein
MGRVCLTCDQSLLAVLQLAGLYERVAEWQPPRCCGAAGAAAASFREEKAIL